jgi:hypothetical protein
MGSPWLQRLSIRSVTHEAKLTWQSMRSVMPPWPGMLLPKSLILKPRLKPLAKKPPKGAITLANSDSTCNEGAEAACQAMDSPALNALHMALLRSRMTTAAHSAP